MLCPVNYLLYLFRPPQLLLSGKIFFTRPTAVENYCPLDEILSFPLSVEKRHFLPCDNTRARRVQLRVFRILHRFGKTFSPSPPPPPLFLACICTVWRVRRHPDSCPGHLERPTSYCFLPHAHRHICASGNAHSDMFFIDWWLLHMPEGHVRVQLLDGADVGRTEVCNADSWRPPSASASRYRLRCWQVNEQSTLTVYLVHVVQCTRCLFNVYNQTSQ